MLREVILPTLGLEMESAIIEKWLKAEGDSVVKDEPLLVVETEKAAMEINAPASGVLRQILHPVGTTVPVTRPIAVIETAEPAAGNGETRERGERGGTRGNSEELRGSLGDLSDSVLSPQSPVHRTQDSALSTQHSALGSQHAARSTPSAVRASPAARRVARELGVDLSLVPGTGPGGRIQGEDVQRFAERTRGLAPAAVASTPEMPVTETVQQEAPAVPAGLPGRLVPMGRKRRVTAERMALSSRSVARITLNMEVDAAELVALRPRLLAAYEARGIKLSYDAILARVVAVALSEHPQLNARWTDRGVYLVEPINVGVAVAAEDGLVAPVIRDAHRKSLVEVAAELGRLAARAMEDRLTLEEMSGGTFTVTNLGMFGVDSFTPIVNPPETAILGVGRIAEKPVGRDGQIVLRPVMMLSLSVDHRVVDGAPAARFLRRVKELLEEPYLLI